jgi:hypothetical protein
MDLRGLLDLLIEQPFFLTDSYYIEIARAIRARYAILTGEARRYYSF